jgi:GNAT superfamily N-acetyltransferase
MWPLSDLALSRRLERCEGLANVSLVEARKRLAPEAGAAWIEVAGALALFDGIGSPITQTFGLGILQTPTAEGLDRIEAFFAERGAPAFHEVSPLAGIETLDVLTARGYRPIEMTSVMYQPIVALPVDPDTRVRTRIAAPDEIDAYAEVSAEGWSELAEVAPLIRDLARVSASSEGMKVFFAELDGRPIGTGAVAMHDGVALLAGASTIPAARRNGAQRALLETRLRFAAEHGCDLAMMGAVPGSASQRNAERQGFRIAYTRTKWGR